MSDPPRSEIRTPEHRNNERSERDAAISSTNDQQTGESLLRDMDYAVVSFHVMVKPGESTRFCTNFYYTSFSRISLIQSSWPWSWQRSLLFTLAHRNPNAKARSRCPTRTLSCRAAKTTQTERNSVKVCSMGWLLLLWSGWWPLWLSYSTNIGAWRFYLVTWFLHRLYCWACWVLICSKSPLSDTSCTSTFHHSTWQFTISTE